MLQVENISGGYGKEPIVKSVTFNVKKGEVLGILGPNGSGKSTLLKIISGILPKETGSVTIDGQDASYLFTKRIRQKSSRLAATPCPRIFPLRS